MRFTSIILQAAVASASVIPVNCDAGKDNAESCIQAKGRPAKPEISDLLVNHNPEDSRASWEETVPELEHVGLAKRSSGDPEEGAAYVAGVRDHGAKFVRGKKPEFSGDFIEDRRERDHERHDEDRDRDNEVEGFEERYWVEAVDHNHQEKHNRHSNLYNSHRNNHEHCQHCHRNHHERHHNQHHNDNHHDHHDRVKRSVEPEPQSQPGEDVKLAEGGPGGFGKGGPGDRFKEFQFRKDHLRDDHRQDHRNADHHDDVEYYKEEIIHDHDQHHNRQNNLFNDHRNTHHDHHHNHHENHHHRNFFNNDNNNHESAAVAVKPVARINKREDPAPSSDGNHETAADDTETAAGSGPVAAASHSPASGPGDQNDFHLGLEEKPICQYLSGIGYKANELQRPVQQFEYENVPWLTHNQGPWMYVLNGLRQIDWVLQKLDKALQETSGFTADEERELVGCYYSFAGIDSPSGDSGEPFKKLLSLLTTQSVYAKNEPYALSRYSKVLQNLHKSYLSFGETLARVLTSEKYKNNILWDVSSAGGVGLFFDQVIQAFDVEAESRATNRHDAAVFIHDHCFLRSHRPGCRKSKSKNKNKNKSGSRKKSSKD